MTLQHTYESLLPLSLRLLLHNLLLLCYDEQFGLFSLPAPQKSLQVSFQGVDLEQTQPAMSPSQKGAVECRWERHGVAGTEQPETAHRQACLVNIG